jgi:hypothetical protein
MTAPQGMGPYGKMEKKLFSEDIDCLNYTDFEQKSFENFIKLV